MRDSGGIDAALATALARQTKLERLIWIARKEAPADLSFLPPLQKLRELPLVNAETIDAAPLLQMPALQRIEAVRSAKAVTDALRLALQDRNIELVLPQTQSRAVCVPRAGWP